MLNRRELGNVLEREIFGKRWRLGYKYQPELNEPNYQRLNCRVRTPQYVRSTRTYRFETRNSLESRSCLEKFEEESHPCLSSYKRRRDKIPFPNEPNIQQLCLVQSCLAKTTCLVSRILFKHETKPLSSKRSPAQPPRAAYAFLLPIVSQYLQHSAEMK